MGSWIEKLEELVHGELGARASRTAKSAYTVLSCASLALQNLKQIVQENESADESQKTEKITILENLTKHQDRIEEIIKNVSDLKVRRTFPEAERQALVEVLDKEVKPLLEENLAMTRAFTSNLEQQGDASEKMETLGAAACDFNSALRCMENIQTIAAEVEQIKQRNSSKGQHRR